MYSSYNPKILELQEVISNISKKEETLKQLENMTNPQETNQERLQKEKAQIEKNINELTEKKEELNEELADNEEILDAIRMKYAIMLLKNFGGKDPEHCV